MHAALPASASMWPHTLKATLCSLHRHALSCPLPSSALSRHLCSHTHCLSLACSHPSNALSRQLYSHAHCTHLSFAHTCTHMTTAPLTADTYSHIPTAHQWPLHSPNLTCSLYLSHLYRHCIHIHKTAWPVQESALTCPLSICAVGTHMHSHAHSSPLTSAASSIHMQTAPICLLHDLHSHADSHLDVFTCILPLPGFCRLLNAQANLPLLTSAGTYA